MNIDTQRQDTRKNKNKNDTMPTPTDLNRAMEAV